MAFGCFWTAHVSRRPVLMARPGALLWPGGSTRKSRHCSSRGFCRAPDHSRRIRANSESTIILNVMIDHPIIEAQRDGYCISTDKARFDVSAIHAYLTRSYWSPGIPKSVVERAIGG